MPYHFTVVAGALLCFIWLYGVVFSRQDFVSSRFLFFCFSFCFPLLFPSFSLPPALLYLEGWRGALHVLVTEEHRAWSIEHGAWSMEGGTLLEQR